MGQFQFDTLDISNPAPRCPAILLLDTSGSMEGAPIQELNEGVRQFVRETSQDEAAGLCTELEIITYDSTVSVILPFTPIRDVNLSSFPLRANGRTSMGAALQRATQDLRERRSLYRNKGISSYRPWVILMTDGAPNDNWQTAAQEMRTLGEQGKIEYIGVEIGSSANHAVMCQILPANPGPVRLQGLRFKQIFRWLTDSLRSVSESTVAEQDNVQFRSIQSWADLANLR